MLWFTVGPAAPLGAHATRAHALVKQLGARSFAARERAAATLLTLGEGAVLPVRQGEHDPDPEVAERCRLMRPAIEEAGREQRLTLFLSDPKAHAWRLPGAARFVEIAGNAPGARRMYVEMYWEHRDILEHVERDGKIPRTDVRIWPEEQPRLRASQALFLTLASDARLRVGSKGEEVLLRKPSSMGRGNDWDKFLTVEPQRASAERLFLHWLASERNDDSLTDGLRIAVAAGLKGALPIAEKCAGDREHPSTVRHQAILALGFFGDARHTDLLERIRTEGSQRGFGITQGEVSVRGTTADVAMGALCQIRGFDLKEVGFGPPKGFDYGPDNYHFYAFATAQDQAAAVKRFEELSRAKKK